VGLNPLIATASCVHRAALAELPPLTCLDATRLQPSGVTLLGMPMLTGGGSGTRQRAQAMSHTPATAQSRAVTVHVWALNAVESACRALCERWAHAPLGSLSTHVSFGGGIGTHRFASAHEPGVDSIGGRYLDHTQCTCHSETSARHSAHATAVRRVHANAAERMHCVCEPCTGTA
jgi:hypothetical protein